MKIISKDCKNQKKEKPICICFPAVHFRCL